MTFTPIAPGTTNWDVPLNGALTTQDNSLASAQGDIAGLQSSVAALQTSVATLNGIVTGATFYRLVAASDASAEVKAKADYVCDGSGDQVEIQAAINAAQLEGGGAIQLSEGTFNIAAPIVINGTTTVNNPRTIILNGCGQYSTTLAPTLNTHAISLSDWAQCRIANLGIVIQGSGSGIVSTAVTSGITRSFWNSSFENLRISGLYVTSNTGWAMNLEMPYRSTFTNIEIEGTRNGIKLINTNSSVYAGNCTFERIYMELVGTASVGVHIESNSGSMSRNTFNILEATTSGTGGTGILIDGAAGGVTQRFWGVILDQFQLGVNLVKGANNVFEVNYLAGDAGQAGNKAFVCGTAAFNNTFSVKEVIVEAAGTLAVLEDNNTNAVTPNIFDSVHIENNTGGTVTYVKQASTVFRDITCFNSGNALPAGLLQYPLSTVNSATFTPADQNLVSWTYDPSCIRGTGVASVSGTVYLMKVKIVNRSTVVTNVIIGVEGAGVTLTAGQNFVGLYDSTGARLAVSADQASSWTSTGMKTIALTAPVTLNVGSYYVAFVSNGATPPTLATGAGNNVNISVGLSSGALRYIIGPTAQTSLPASITLTSFTGSTASRFAALS